MFIFFSRRKSGGNALPEQRAREIIEAEIQRRGWSEFPDREYRIERRTDRDLWCYSGVDITRIGSMMNVQIDAITGEVVHAALAPR